MIETPSCATIPHEGGFPEEYRLTGDSIDIMAIARAIGRLCRQGLMSVTTGVALAVVAPALSLAADLEAPTPEPGLFDQKYLTGNWGGARDQLYAHGFIFDFQLTQFYQGLLSGPGSKDAEYGGKADYIMYFIGDLVGIKGLTVALHGETRFGNDVNALAPFAPPNVNMLYPEPVVQSSYLTQWLISQQFTDDGWAVIGGKLNGIDLMDTTFHTGRGIEKFMNTALVLPLGFARTTNLSVMGAGFMKLNGRETEGALLFYDTNNSSFSNGFDDLFDDGFVALGLWRFFYDMGGLPGNSTVFGNYSTRTFTDIDPDSFIYYPGIGLFPSEIEGSWVAGYAFDQVIWADAVNAKRKVGLSGQFTVTDGNPNPIKWTAAVALEVNGVASRDDDSIGIGFFYNGLSDSFVDLAAAVDIKLEDLSGLEVYYRMQFAPWWSVTADLQVIDTTVFAADTEVIGAIRSNIKF